RPNRLPEVWPILEAGRLLEPVSDCRPRRMTIQRQNPAYRPTPTILKTAI
ncbi:MAG: hypothetical protein ACJAZP_003385, partial [Psychromonas sp.]